MTHATAEDIIDALAEYLRESHAAARPAAFRVIVDRLRERYGTKLVDKALLQYEREMRAENRRLKQDNRRLERQARAEWMKRQ